MPYEPESPDHTPTADGADPAPRSPLRPAEEPPEVAAPASPAAGAVTPSDATGGRSEERDGRPTAAAPRQLRPAEVFNARPGRRGPARDAAQRHGDDPAPLFDFATGKLLPAPFPRRGPGKAPDPHDPPHEPPVEAGSRLPPGRGGAFPGGNPSDNPRPKRPKPVARSAAPPDGADLLRIVNPVGPRTPEDVPSGRPGGDGGMSPAEREPFGQSHEAGDHVGAGLRGDEARALRASPPQPVAPPGARRGRSRTVRPSPARPAPGGPRRLGLPVPVHVATGQSGRPRAIDGDAVEAVRESWLIEDRWWTAEPLRRRYWEVVTAAGRNLVVFRDLERGTWAMQR